MADEYTVKTTLMKWEMEELVDVFRGKPCFFGNFPFYEYGIQILLGGKC